jgi:thiol-disulfide isomerase/thioredoxin
MKFTLTLCLVLVACVAAFGQNEQSPIVEKDILYRDWTLKSVRDFSDLDLRDLIKGKKLVAVVYFAPWCHNWQLDAPMLQRLYDKYEENGFEIVAVGEYGTVDEMVSNLDTFKITFPVVFESQMRSAVDRTLHNSYRRTTGDTRDWGSPYYVFIEPAAVAKKGDVLLKHTSVINGEMVESEGERFIRQKLGLPPEETKTAFREKKDIEACDPSKPTQLKKSDEKPD